jgi:hypothetical protein
MKRNGPALAFCLSVLGGIWFWQLTVLNCPDNSPPLVSKRVSDLQALRYVRTAQWRADARTLAAAVTFLLEPENLAKTNQVPVRA